MLEVQSQWQCREGWFQVSSPHRVHSFNGDQRSMISFELQIERVLSQARSQGLPKEVRCSFQMIQR